MSPKTRGNGTKQEIKLRGTIPSNELRYNLSEQFRQGNGITQFSCPLCLNNNERQISMACQIMVGLLVAA